MNTSMKILSATAAGAGLMYLFDPDRGKRRRALICCKLMDAIKLASDVVRALTKGHASDLVDVKRERTIIEEQERVKINVPVDERLNYWLPPESPSEIISHVHELSCSTLTR